MSPTLSCSLSPEYQGWRCLQLPSCHHLRICQTMNRNSVTRFPVLWRQLLPQCLQARAWVSWAQRSPLSHLAPSRSSSSHSIFLSLVAVYPDVITTQNKEFPSPTYLTAFSLNLGPKNCRHQTTCSSYIETCVIRFPFVLIAKVRIML